jgi:pSer/pThr/pTyr-binding forkhead associated (FHA) protein
MAIGKHKVHSLLELARVATELDQWTFEDRFGRAFFIVEEGAGHGRSIPNATTSGPASPSPSTEDLKLIAVPIVRRAGSRNEFITVGRLDGNDVCLNDTTVSKYHAMIFLRDDEVFILDSGSHNGTYVNDQSVPKRGKGAPVKLSDGQVVTFASLMTSFMTGAGLIQFSRRIAERRASAAAEPPARGRAPRR